MNTENILDRPSPRTTIRFNREWTFRYFPDSEPDPTRATYHNGNGWQAVSLPHTWNTFETTREIHPFIAAPSEKDDPFWLDGWGWYHKEFTVDQSVREKKVFMEFDGVQKFCRIYLNGLCIDEHKGGFTSFSVDITDTIRFGEVNTLAVEVCNRRNDPDCIAPMTAGNWVLYGGIYRDVRLVITDRLHIPYQGSFRHEGGTYVTTPAVSENEGTVRILTFVENDFLQTQACRLETTIRTPRGEIAVAGSSTMRIDSKAVFECIQEFTIPHPRLWSIESPALYEVESRVFRDDLCIDSYCSPLGFRWFHWDYDSRQLVLNGKPVHLHGFNRHQEYPWLGDALPGWLHTEEMEDIKYNLGCTFMRTCHYPQDQLIYDFADRHGILICEEVPNIKNIAFSEEAQRQNLIEMIRRDRNHPSIIMWSIGNETNCAANGDWAREEDPTRIVHARSVWSGRYGVNEPHNKSQINMENLLQCTVRGWYDRDDRNLPGMHEDSPGHKGGQLTNTEEWQHEMSLDGERGWCGQIAENNCIVWIYADHGADREYYNCPLKHVNPKGFVDLYRFPKYAYYLWQANHSLKPMVFIHPHFWRSKYLGSVKDIKVDSNCGRVELFCDNRKVGEAYPSRYNFFTILFKDIEIQDCALKSIAYHENGTVEHILPMTGVAVAVKLSGKNLAIPADRSGIALIRMDIVDQQGNHVYGATNSIEISIQGPGRLILPHRIKSDTDKVHADSGTMYIDAPMIIPVRSCEVAGTITIKVDSPGLTSGTIAVEAVPVDSEKMHKGILQYKSKGGERFAIANRECSVLRGNMPPPLYHDIIFSETDEHGYRTLITSFVLQNSPGMQVQAEWFPKLVDHLISRLVEGKGHIIADDYNSAMIEFFRN